MATGVAPKKTRANALPIAGGFRETLAVSGVVQKFGRVLFNQKAPSGYEAWRDDCSDKNCNASRMNTCRNVKDMIKKAL